MEVVVLHNAKAGDGSWSREELVRLIERAGFKPRYYPLKTALKRPELLDRGDFIAVAGGDGAIRKVALAVLGRNRPIAPLPLGTANNIARSFGVTARLEKIVKGWRKPRRQKFDVGFIKGPWGVRHFVEGVGVGLVSRAMAVVEAIDDVAKYELKKRKDRLHRDICVLAALAHEMHPLSALLSIDGRDLSDDFLLVEILNIRRAGPGVELASHASAADGRFDVVTATADQRERLWKALQSRLTDSTRVHNLTTRRARRIQLQVGETCEMRIDDQTLEVKGETVMEIGIEAGALELVLPG